MKLTTYIFPLTLLFSGACSDVEGHDHDHDHDQEVITTVEVAFTPQSGGDPLVYVWTDPEAGGNPVIDDIVLVDLEDYDMRVSFLNGLEDPPEDITPEVADEADEHQVFFTGSGVQGPATGTNGSAVVDQVYTDADADGLPLGLENTFTTLGLGSGELTVTLRHLPAEDGSPVKLEGLAEDIATNGFGAIGGANDAQVTFAIEVQ